MKYDLHVQRWHSGQCNRLLPNRSYHESRIAHPKHFERLPRRPGIVPATNGGRDSARPSVWRLAAFAATGPRLLNYAREIAFSYRWTSHAISEYSRRSHSFEFPASPVQGEEA